MHRSPAQGGRTTGGQSNEVERILKGGVSVYLYRVYPTLGQGLFDLSSALTRILDQPGFSLHAGELHLHEPCTAYHSM